MTRTIETTRLDSIDALRGFDMFFITGGAGLIHALHKACPNAFSAVLDAHMTHMAWDGFAFYDMIFPLFLFIAGVSFPFSLAASRRRGFSERRIVGNILRRCAMLVLLGLVFNGLFRLDFETMRYASVLSRIGIAWAIAALVYRSTSARTRLCTILGILVGYGILLATVAAPDAPAGASPLSMEGNIVGFVDRHWLPGQLLDGRFDPLGLLSTLPAIATALLGMFAGDAVRSSHFSECRRVSILSGAGLALIFIGLLLDPVLPINKPLWSSSYVCFTGGLSMLLFAAFYWIIDVRGWRRWSFYFRIIGLNSITIYMLQKIVDLKGVARFFFGGASELVPTAWSGVVLATGYLLIVYVILRFLYKRNIFLKV